MGDGQNDKQQLAYRLSKGLHDSHVTSRDLRAEPRPPGPHRCAGCGAEIGEAQSTMWLDDQPYHVRCGREVVERRDAEARTRLERRFRQS